MQNELKAWIVMCGEYLRINNNTLVSCVFFSTIFLSLLGMFSLVSINKGINQLILIHPLNGNGRKLMMHTHVPSAVPGTRNRQRKDKFGCCPHGTYRLIHELFLLALVFSS